MDHEVVPCSSKICDRPLNSPKNHFGLNQEKNERVTMELEVPSRPIFMPTLSIVMVQRVLRVGEMSLTTNVRRPWQRNVALIFWIFLLNVFHSCDERKEEEGMKVKHEEISQNYPFWSSILKISTSTLWCMVNSLGSRLVFTWSWAQRL